MISVIIPVYNSGKYLAECMNSILAQTYTNYEVIIVDDGSIDDSREIIKNYSRQCKNIKSFFQENGGAAKARNFGIRAATGKYLMFVDSDDYLAPNAMALMVDKLNQFNADMEIIGHVKFNDTNVNEEYLYDLDDNRYYTSMEALDLILKFKVKGYVGDKLFLRDKWNKLNLTFEHNRYCEDWFPIVKYMINSEKVVFVNKSIYFYRQHNNSSIHTSSIRVIKDYNYAVKTIIDYMQKKSIKADALETFKIFTFLETIHELYLVSGESEKNIYSEFRENKLNSWNFGIKNLLNNKDISMKKKLTVISWKLKIYHLVKCLS